MGTISDKLTYLNTTKTKIREGLNSLGADLDTEDTFRSYADAIEGIYEDYPKITGEGTDLSLDNTKQALMQIDYKGNTSQNGTPTPTTPVPINVVSGDNTINICGKNLFGFNLSAIDKTSTYRTTSTQQLIITGTDNPNEVKFNYNNGPYSRGYFEINGIDGTLNYNISFNVKEKTSSYNPVATIDTSNSTSEKLVFYISGNNGGTNVSSDNYFILNNIQVEKGTTQTTFEPYIGHSYLISLPSGIELCKIGDYQDYFYKDSGKWYLHKEIGKVVLDGSESWNRTGTKTSGNYYFFGDSFISNVKFENNIFIGIANMGITTSAYQEVQGFDIIFYNNYIRSRFYSETTKAMSNEDFKTWLSTHNTIVYYVLATPTNTLIEDTTLINQLEEAKLSYISQTNISQVNNDLPFNLDVKALRGE